MKISLENNWDEPVQSPAPKQAESGHFVGREIERLVLVNELRRKKQGAILISGYRGVGKTSLVYKALHEVRAKEKDKFIFVFINAPQLEADDPNNEAAKSIQPGYILANLIRRLYTASRDIELQDSKHEIEELYLKAVASTARLHLSDEETTEDEQKKEFENENILSTDKLGQIIWSVGLVLATTTATIPFPENITWLQKLLILLFASPAPLFTNNILTRKKKSTIVLNKSKRLAHKEYTLDATISNLEYDLEKIHRTLSENNKKVIYIIDELDKLSNEKIKTVFQYFKNFFTLSSALFIFIGGEKLYDIYNIYNKSTSLVQDDYRALEYTFFNSVYYLSRPTEIEIDQFLDSISRQKEKNTNDTYYKEFKRTLIFDAEGDFYDLIKVLKDRISSFNGECPEIEVGALSQEDHLKSGLQQALSVVFNEYKASNPSRWHENEIIQRYLYKKAKALLDLKIGTQFSDDGLDTIEAKATKDLYIFLERLNLLTRRQKTNKVVNAKNMDINLYQYNGSIAGKIPDKLSFRSQVEEQFVVIFDEFISNALSLYNYFLLFSNKSPLNQIVFKTDLTNYVNDIDSWGGGLKSLYATLFPVFETLSKSAPYPYTREEIEQYTTTLVGMKKTLETNKPKILASIIEQALEMENLNLQVETLNNNPNLFSGPLIRTREKISGVTHWVVFNQDLTKQALIISSSLFGQKLDIDDVSLIGQNQHNYMVILPDTKSKRKRGILSLPSTPSNPQQIIIIRNWFLAGNKKVPSSSDKI